MPGFRQVGNQLVPLTPEEEAEIAAQAAYDAAHPPPAVTYKADIWRRATDEEAEAIEAGLEMQDARSRNLFRDALYLDHTDAEFADLLAAFQAAFGEGRAAELLAPSGSL